MMRLSAGHARTAALLLVALFLAGAVEAAGRPAGSRQLQGDTVQAAIVGGANAVKGRYPWIASLRVDTPGFPDFCGGTLIHPSIILTAAHCFFDEQGDWAAAEQVYPMVRIGGYETNGGKGFDTRYALDTVVHEEYDPDSSDNDIALILLDKPSTKTRIKLPPSEPDPPVPAGTMLTAIGWGYLKDKGASPKVLQEVGLDMLSLSTCKRFIPEVDWLESSKICAGTPSRRKDTCNGDSGGPLFRKHPSKPALDMQVGVVSYGYGCAKAMPGVYTDIAWMRNWVDSTMSDLLAAAKKTSRTARAATTVHGGNSTARTHWRHKGA